MSVDLAALSADELDLLLVNRAAVDEVLGPDVAPTVRATVARLQAPLVLTVYRDARIAGLCHDGACELASDRARTAARETPHAP